MTEQQQHAPLIRSSSEQTSVSVEPQNSTGSNRKAFKWAGLVLLVGVLIGGQALTGYMLYSQRQQLQSLEMRNERLEEFSRRSMVARTPVRMQLPMNSLSVQLDSSHDEASPVPKEGSATMTQCQRQASGLVQTSLPSFRPRCDQQGAYLPQQCWSVSAMCWCVDANGSEIPGTLTRGASSCGSGTRSSIMHAEPARVMSLPVLKSVDVDQ